MFASQLCSNMDSRAQVLFVSNLNLWLQVKEKVSHNIATNFFHLIFFLYL